jgi:hypothetical protein
MRGDYMALDSEIIRILEEQAQGFNQSETRAIEAQVRLPVSKNPGRGNYDAGRYCVYDIFIVPTSPSLRYGWVLRVSHPDEAPYPATIIFSNSEQENKEVTAVSAAHLSEKVKEIFALEGTEEGIKWLLR